MPGAIRASMDIAEALKPLVVPISSVKPDPRNARIHDERNINTIKKSLETYGQRKPIVVNHDGIIEAGNGLYQAAKELGWSEIAAVMVKDDGDHAKAYALMDNQSALLADWSMPDLKDLLQELDTGAFDMEATGFLDKEIEDLMTQFHVLEEGLTDDDAVPEKTLICDNCGSEFGLCESIYEFRVERNEHFFCSKQCYCEFHSKDSFITSCIICGKEVLIPNYRKKEGRKYFCSYECRKTSQKIKCDWCGREFLRKPSEIKEHNFCSRECMGNWQSENMIGENSNSWLGGWEKYYGANWNEQKNKARERDNYTCQKCGIIENGKAHDVHHKIAFREFGIINYKEANRLENLITLCSSCHSSIEPKRQNFTGKQAEKINA